jgi:hypothetical protein
MYVSTVAERKNVAWPSGLYAECDLDNREVENYACVTRAPEGFRDRTPVGRRAPRRRRDVVANACGGRDASARAEIRTEPAETYRSSRHLCRTPRE